MKKVGIIVPTYGLSWMTLNLFESIKTCSKLKDFYFIVVDNGSTQEESDKVFSWLCDNYKDEDFYFSFHDKPIGFVKAVNEGMDEVLKKKLDYFFISNNDVLVTDEWDKRLLETLKKDKVGIVGGMTSPPDWRRLPAAEVIIKEKLKYKIIRGSMEGFARVLRDGLKGLEKEVNFLAFYFVGIKTELVKEIGKLDEDFNMGLFDDDDFNLRAKKAKWKTILRKDVYIHHYHRSTWIEHGMKYHKLLMENKLVFKKKHGFDPWKGKKIV